MYRLPTYLPIYMYMGVHVSSTYLPIYLPRTGILLSCVRTVAAKGLGSTGKTTGMLVVAGEDGDGKGGGRGTEARDRLGLGLLLLLLMMPLSEGGIGRGAGAPPRVCMA